MGKIVSYTTPGSHSFTVPPNVDTVTARVRGPGGPSGGGRGGVGGGNAGGGGAYSERVHTGLTPGDIIPLWVGDGGTGGIAGTPTVNAGPGIIGADSWFLANNSTGTVAKAGGPGDRGGVATAGTGGQAAAGHGTIKFSGGNGSVFSGGSGAHGGGSAGSTGNGGNATPAVAGAAGTGGGTAGSARTVAGVAPGGGAGGTAAANTAGHAGGTGSIELEFEQTLNLSDEAGITEELTLEVRGTDPEHVLNDALDMRWGTELVDRVMLGSTEVWSSFNPYPFQLFVPSEAGKPFSFFVPDGVYNIKLNGTGGRGGNGVTSTGPGGIGGYGGLTICDLEVEPGDYIHGYTGQGGDGGAAGINMRGGEPGGGGTQRNINGGDFNNLGGQAGGMTIVYRNGILVFIAGGAGAGGCGGVGGGVAGGNGGNGGGLIGQDGTDGDYTQFNYRGQKGTGGTQVGPGANGAPAQMAPVAAIDDDIEPIFLAGGVPGRVQDSYVGFSYAQAGGGGAGLYGGGAGGPGSTNAALVVVFGAAGGGGGGPSYTHPTWCTGVRHVQGGNPDFDGSLFVVMFGRVGTELVFL